SLPILDQVFHHAGVGQGGDVADLVGFAFCDFPEDAAHDFARAGFGQGRGPVNHVRGGDGADLFADVLHENLLQFVGVDLVGLERDVGVDALALDLVGEADHGGLGDGRVRDEGAFDLGGAHAVAGDIDHVIHAAGDPVVAVLVAPAAVAGEVHAGVVAEISLLEALVLA